MELSAVVIFRLIEVSVPVFSTILYGTSCLGDSSFDLSQSCVAVSRL
jgi:hypothetical protein